VRSHPATGACPHSLARVFRGTCKRPGHGGKFLNPVGVGVDPTTLNVYVGDFTGHRVRRITPTGAVSTFTGTGTAGSLGGTGVAASHNSPRVCPLTHQETPIVADSGNLACARSPQLVLSPRLLAVGTGGHRWHWGGSFIQLPHIHCPGL
jgi:hypothetical protein